MSKQEDKPSVAKSYWQRVRGFLGLSDDSVVTPHKLAMRYVEDNWKNYEGQYGQLVEDILLSKIVRYIMVIEFLVATFLSSLKTGLWYHNLVHLPLYIILIGYPWLKEHALFKRRQHWILNITIYFLVAEWLLSAWLYHISGAWAHLSSGIGTFVMLLTWFLTSTPRRVHSIIIASGASVIFLSLFHLMAPAFLKDNLIGLQMGCIFGFTCNFLMSVLMRYKFFFIEQERSIREKSEEIVRILESVKHGIFQIGVDKSGRLRISERTSPYFKYIFGELHSHHFDEVILSRLKLSDDKKSMLASALLSSIGEDRLNFDVNEEYLPHEMTIVGTDGSEKIIESVWTPLANPSNPDLVDMVLVSTTDVTDMRRLTKGAEAMAHKTGMLAELIPLGRARAISYMEGVSTLIGQAETELASMPEALTVEHMNRLFIYLHTIKGTARTAGFAMMAGATHEAESRIDERRKSKEPQLSQSDGKGFIQAVAQYIREYTEVMNSIGWNLSRHIVEISPQAARGLIERTDLMSLMDSGALPDLEESLAPFVRRLSSIAREAVLGSSKMAFKLGKPAPRLIVGGDLWLKEESIKVISRVLPHLLANSIDHGFESPEERVRLGKDHAGSVTVDGHRDHATGRWCIVFSDDGRGINPRIIHEKAIAAGVVAAAKPLTEEEKAELIFAPNFSTKDAVSEFSGRGAGLDAVVHEIRAMGGRIRVELVGPFVEGLRPMRIWIELSGGLILREAASLVESHA